MQDGLLGSSTFETSSLPGHVSVAGDDLELADLFHYLSLFVILEFVFVFCFFTSIFSFSLSSLSSLSSFSTSLS